MTGNKVYFLIYDVVMTLYQVQKKKHKNKTKNKHTEKTQKNMLFKWKKTKQKRKIYIIEMKKQTNKHTKKQSRT